MPRLSLSYLFALIIYTTLTGVSCQRLRTNKNLNEVLSQFKYSPDVAELISLQTKDDTGTYPRLSEYNGMSYDIFVGNPLSNKVDEGFTGRRIFNFTYDVDRKTTDGNFYIPNEVDVADDLSCSFTSTSKQHTGLKSYFEDLEANAKISGSTNAWVAKVKFTASTGYEEMKSTVAEESKVSIVTKATCKLYTGTLRTVATTLTDDFKNAVQEAYQNDAWSDFIEDWGTHYAYTIEYGAAAIEKTVFSRKDVQKLTSTGLDVAASVSAKFASVRGSASASVSMSESQSNAFSSASSKTTSSYVGLQPPSSFDTNEWLSSISNSEPVPLTFELAPISDLFTTTYFGSTYTETDLANLATAFDTAVVKLALTMNRAPNLDAFLDDASIVIERTLYGNTDATINFEHANSTDVLSKASKVCYCVRSSDSLVSGIGLYLWDGATETEKTPSGPCNGGTWKNWTVPENHTISTVDIWYNNGYISALYFRTDRGAASPFIGSKTGAAYRHSLDGKELDGFYGSYDTTALTSLGVVARNIGYSYTPSIVAGTTSAYGGSSDDFTSFTDPELPSTNIELSKITMYIYKSSYIAGIKVTVLDEGSTLENSLHGLSTVGTAVDFVPESGKTIQSVTIYYDCLVRGLQFVYSDGTTSSLYGSNGAFEASVTIDGEITGVFGTEIFSGIESLGFIYNSYV